MLLGANRENPPHFIPTGLGQLAVACLEMVFTQHVLPTPAIGHLNHKWSTNRFPVPLRKWLRPTLATFYVLDNIAKQIGGKLCSRTQCDKNKTNNRQESSRHFGILSYKMGNLHKAGYPLAFLAQLFLRIFIGKSNRRRPWNIGYVFAPEASERLPNVHPAFTMDSSMLMPNPEEQRRFAVDVVRRLRGAGFEAYWAGGCVRDQLLERTPKDYDVATNATPDEVRALFGRRRTLAIGAAFGVIAVVGPKSSGTVEVTTFRRDAAYSDGRHPDSVAFSSAEEDASRRDFTINGLFYDPIEQHVIDYVGGQADLAQKHLRAIGHANERFAEDKLRMLRAVRFTAAFAMTLDEEARQAIEEMASEIRAVSPERIAMEMRRLLADASRAVGVRLLLETRLAEAMLPEIVPCDERQQQRFEQTLNVLARLGEMCGFPLALAALLCPSVDAARAEDICRRWRLSNKETERVVWLVQNHAALADARSMRWSQLYPLLMDDGADDLLILTESILPEGPAIVSHCRELLSQPHAVLDPPPLVSGDDLRAAGIPPGPEYKTLLQHLRDAQLDGQISSKVEALATVKKWIENGG